MQKIIISLVLIILFSLFRFTDCFSQDVHFSRYDESPLFVNPSYTGFFEGNWRFTNNYRSQWNALGNPFNTLTAGFDMPFKLRRGAMGAGIYLVNDQSGAAKLTSDKVFLSVAYKREFRNNLFSIGGQVGYVIQSYNMGSLSFPSQYDPNTGYFDSDMPLSIDNQDDKANFPDVNLGIAWSREFERFTPVAGFSILHINNPNLTYLNNDDSKLPLRFTFNAYAMVPLENNWYARPDIYTSFTNKASDYLVGGIAGYEFPAEYFLDKAYAGTRIRTQFHSTDAAVVLVGVGFMGFDVGISYDINVSGLRKATNMRGAYELTIVYTNFVEKINKITIPCNRY